jgi:Mg-chelatase subunit ChlD
MLGTSVALAKEDEAKKPPPSVEVCFVLDTTGSMQGLIDGAKQKIWSIANTIIATEPRPTVRIALIGYRDRGDAYVTKRFDLTDDIDTVFKNLTDFQADGGGDTPESVNQAMDEAVNKITWSPSRDVTKLIFLVGDAPPHMDYADDVKYTDTCTAAVKKDLRINTVQCGNIGETRPIWEEIAKRAEGQFVPLGQTGDMIVIATPFDEKLAKLSEDVSRTVLPYGEVRQQREVAMKLAAPTTAPASVSADRAMFLGLSSKAVTGAGDLVDAVKRGEVKVADVKNEDLSPEMQKMTPAEREALVAKNQAEREALQTKIAEVSRERQAYIDAEKKKQAAAGGKRDSFDEAVARIVADQKK